MKSLIFFCCFTLAACSLSAQKITMQEQLMYYMKINNYAPGALIPRELCGFENNSRVTWAMLYLSCFDSRNYQQNVNDEFKFRQMVNTAASKMSSILGNLDLSKKFTAIIPGTFGTYDFGTGSFPLDLYLFNSRYSHPSYQQVVAYAYSGCFKIATNSFSNYDDVPFFLKMPENDASKFVDSRKNANGDINRRIYLKITYTIVNQATPEDHYADQDMAAHISLVEVWSDAGCTKTKLATIMPRPDYQKAPTKGATSDHPPAQKMMPKTTIATVDPNGIDPGLTTNGTGVVAPPPPPAVFTYVEQMPTAGYDYQDYLNKNIHYPDTARENNIEGKVIVKYIVNEDGSLSDITVVRGVDPYLDAEAKRVVRTFPKWNPGTQNGKAVKVYFTLPIVFKLQ